MYAQKSFRKNTSSLHWYRIDKNGKIFSDVCTTDVTMKNLSDEEILNYIQTKEPQDKAGAYAIQGLASIFIEKINGCYFNVVGLPLNCLYNLCKKS